MNKVILIIAALLLLQPISSHSQEAHPLPLPGEGRWERLGVHPSPRPTPPTWGLTSTRLSTLDGLGSNSISTMLQDQRGYLWFGTSEGLSRYDGLHFINFFPDGDRTPGFINGNIDRLYEDTLHHTLWLASISGLTSCFDLQQGQFVDFLDGKDAEAELPEFFVSSYGLILSGERYGLRQVYFENGRPHSRDFTEAGGQLHANRMRPVCEDAEGKVWLPTHRGLATLTPDGQLRYLEDTLVYRAVTADADKVYVVDDSNNFYTYRLNGTLLSKQHIPEALGSTEKVWAHVRWRGQWLLFGQESTIICTPAPSHLPSFSSPNGWNVTRAKYVRQISGYIFLTADDRDLMVFKPDGQVRRLALLPQAVMDMGIRARYRFVQVSDSKFLITVNGNGLFAYDAATDELTHYSATDASPIIHSDNLLDVLVDRSGAVWLSNEIIGLTLCKPKHVASQVYLPSTPTSPTGGPRGASIRTIYPVSDTTFMVSAGDGSVYSFNSRQCRFEHTGYVHNLACAILRDRRGRLWIGTRGDGVSVDGQLYNQQTTPPCPSYNIYGIAEDQRGGIWMASMADGLICAEDSSDTFRFRQFLTEHTTFARQHAICVDANGWLWVGTNAGIFLLDTNKPIDAQPHWLHFSKQEGNFCMDIITSLAPDSQGRMWVGSMRDGAARVSLHSDGTISYTHVTRDDGLLNANVLSIQPDRSGAVWLATNDGIARWDTLTGIARHYQLSSDLQSNVYAAGCAAIASNGDLLFGTTRGLMRISPYSYQTPSTSPLPREGQGVGSTLTDILVQGASLAVQGRLPAGISQLSLPHDQNTVTFHFSTLSPAAQDVLSYTYWLEGYDKPSDLHVTDQGEAVYTHLPPGRYVLHVNVAGLDTDELLFTLTIQQPWWNTWWAWLIYTLFAIAIAITIYRQLRTVWRLRQRMKMEQLLTQYKLDFFTQVSHEFRTPLALISTGVDKLASSRDKRVDTTQLQVVRRGAHRLNRLVDQLLQFRRLNQHTVRIHATEGDIVRLARSVYSDFFTAAQNRDLNYQFVTFASSYTMTFDPQAVENIIYNVVSNAVKYTPAGGKVVVHVHAPAEGRLVISVANTGASLTPEQREKLFQPYMHGYVSQGGMGIGLYVAHQLASISHGELTYSEPADGGVLFSCSLPTSADVFSAEELQPHTSALTSSLPSPLPWEGLGVGSQGGGSQGGLSTLLPRAANSQRIAIIEDDDDMAEQLRQDLGPYFNVHVLTDGNAGLQYVLDQRPDLVVCDVMLPGTDGFTLCQHIKANDATRHIPVVMLTSLHDDVHHLRGIQNGADVFLTKPCSPAVLVHQVAQLLRTKHSHPSPQPTPPTGGPRGASREQVQQLMTEIANASADDAAIITTLSDKRFKDDVTRIITQNITSADFSVDVIMSQVGMGRTMFFRRFKALFGSSPSDYIKAERMRRAAELIQAGRLTIAEVAQQTGYSDTSHFIRAFKAHFGTTPNQYRKL